MALGVSALGGDALPVSPVSFVSCGDAVEWLLGAPGFLRSVDVGSVRSGNEVQGLVDAARLAQVALDGFVTRLGLAAARSAPDGVSGEMLLRGRARVVRSGTARRDAARVETVGVLSEFADAVVVGRVGGDQLDSLARAVRGLDDDQRQRLNTSEMVKAAVDLPADEFDRRVRAVAKRAKADHGLGDAVAARKRSEFRHWFDHREQVGKFCGQLDPERYEILHTAIDRTVSVLARDADDVTEKNHNLAADALMALVEGRGSSGSGQASITVIVDEQTVRFGAHEDSVRQTGNGHDVPPETVDRLWCDATLRRVVLDSRGVPVDVGRRYRTATDAQWAAIKALYSTCGWDGCDRPISWCQLHHIAEWEHGGPTDLDNLLPLCSRHHHQVHEGRWSVKLLADRSLKIIRPDGVVWAVTPTPSRRAPPTVAGRSP